MQQIPQIQIPQIPQIQQIQQIIKKKKKKDPFMDTNTSEENDEELNYCRGFSQELCPPECSPLDCQPEIKEDFPRDGVPVNPRDHRIVEGFSSNSVNVNGNLDSQNNLNYVDRPDLDIQGCRLDNRRSDLNYTNFGPPLSSCQAFNKQSFDNTGTFFYPLN